MTQKEFEYLSTLTPIVNVDLLIKNKYNQTLLSYRDDHLFKGWHFPGRCIRFKETLHNAVKQCCLLEIGFVLTFKPNFIYIQEDICKERDIRGHFISFLYLCFYDIGMFPSLIINTNKKENDNGYLKWFDKCPIDLLNCHKNYKKFFNKKDFD